MLNRKIVSVALGALEKSPQGIITLDVLESLKLSDSSTLKTTLSRLAKGKRILRLKRGVYSTNPMRDAFACAQNTFNGYLGFSSALYLHKLIAEVPFTIFVVTPDVSAAKKFGALEFKAVALKEKAFGFERKGGYVVSTRAKTLFDCLYLPEYSTEEEKLVQAFRLSPLSAGEWKEFDFFAKKLLPAKKAGRFFEAKREILGGI